MSQRASSAPPSRSEHDRERPPDGGLGSICVGRERELSELLEMHAHAQAGGERLVLVEGDAGTGKSSLLHELARRTRLDGGVVLEGRCDPGRAFGPFATIVERSLRFLDDMSLTPSIELRDLGCNGGCHRFWHQHDDGALEELASSRDARERRLRFFDAVRGVIRDVSRVRAPLVLLHDLERADAATLQLLRFIFEGAGPWNDGVNPERSLRALFVSTVALRKDHPVPTALEELRDHEAAHRIRLGQLDFAGVRAFLQSEAAVRRVLDRTEGVPERIELLLEAEPLTPERALERRLAGLPEATRALLEGLSVLRHPADLELLAAVADCTPDAAARAAFADSGLVHRSVLDGRILFAYQRESQRALTYAQVDAARRQALHRRCADLFVEQGQRERAAHHALEAEDHARAIPLALEAASTFAARHAHAEAAALLERVLEDAPAEDIPVELHEYLAELYRVVGDYGRALVHAEQVREQRPEHAQAAHRVGRLLTLAGKLDQAAPQLREAHDLAEDVHVRAQVETALAELDYQRARYDDAERWAEAALELAVEADELSLQIHARNTLGKVALARKEASAAAELFEANHALASKAGLGHQEAQALTNLGVARMRQQRLGDAKRCFADAAEVATTVGDLRDLAIATENLAVLAHLRRDYREALAHYHQAVAQLKRLGNRAMLTRVGLNLGWLYLALGDTDRARSLHNFAQHMGGANLPPLFAAECLLLRGQIELDADHPEAAQGYLEASHDGFSKLKSVKVVQPLMDLARLALDAGDVARARELLLNAPSVDTPRYTAELAVLGSDLERAAGGDVLGSAQRAVRLAEETEDEELVLEALLRLGRALCDHGDGAEASRVLERAQNLEAGLAERVPEEAKASWLGRKTRERLAQLEARVATTARGTRRISQMPAARKRPAELDKRYPDIVGSSASTLQLLEVLDKVAPSDATVLVRGESGTGKELVAEALHRHSSRRDKPLVKVNCAALVETLLLSELFGHERGAFTGASSRKKGRFELADGGTLFLDEIGDISPKTQVALLRVLQEREFERVGGTQPIKVDVRIIAATHRNLEQMVEEGTFREDLYYRLRGVTVEVPALRERLEDIPELSAHLLGRIAEERGEEAKRVSPPVAQMLGRHRWPGNVRELQNVLRSATLFAEGPVLAPADFAAFGETFGDPSEEAPADGVLEGLASWEDALYSCVRDGENSLLEMKKVIERECIARALSETEGNITRAASLLGMKRPRLSQLVKQYGLGSQKRARS
ncbi:MAG TPA: sigma 54-interacting transcriptional regulator [Polyangiaceae bacterium LLY-WYZ-15_(1-7)]|nr:sigma 54-interacting transcriptional regulator [Polyangiaceae bacterium LLY-WYZ-15_(1-7)]HJL12223.1 sigma 54-interacting transcriptional regulator [Polyangiaceae bacterium LLY-WYZ-15_(1-7)]